jgi:nicotinamidase-related amidase
MTFSETALFVIDIQHDLVGDPSTEIPHAARIKEAGSCILSTVRQLNTDSERPTLVVFVQHEEPPESGSLVRGSDAWKLAFDPLPGQEHEILVSKTTRNTFETNPRLAKQLKDWGIRRVVAFGVQSECCVQETCKGALDAGFEVTLLRGAHSTYSIKEKSAEQIEVSVEEMLQSRGARLIDWEKAVSAWESSSRVD